MGNFVDNPAIYVAEAAKIIHRGFTRKTPDQTGVSDYWKNRGVVKR